jgi:hypothetical protein
MGTAALLIDWDNLKIAMLDGHYEFEVAKIAHDLREAVAQEAKSVDPGFNLDEAIAFAPALALDPQTSLLLQNNKVTPYPTAGSKQAADLMIAIRAMQLFYGNPRVKFFVIVSGDSDYLPLADELNRGGSQCYIWAVDKNHTPSLLRNRPYVAYVIDKIPTGHHNGDTGPEQQDIFLLLCHRIIDKGFHLDGVNFTLQKLAELGVWDRTKVERMWGLITRGHLVVRLESLNKNDRVRRRLAYERIQDVLEKIWTADILVQQASRKGRLSRGDAISLLEQCKITGNRGPAFLTALCVAGYLTRSGDLYVPGDGASRYGLIGPAIRVALAFSDVTCERKQEALGLGQLATRFWPRFFKPGGHLNEVEIPQAKADANLAVDRTVAMRMGEVTHVTTDRGQRVKAQCRSVKRLDVSA